MGTEEANKIRRQRGWGTIDVVGWERMPFYDANTNNLTWAITGSSEEGNSVNYSTRLLGRRGVINADLVIVVCRTNPDAGRNGLSLLVVERGMAGFERGRNLDKIGQHSADTAELSFTDVRVPAANVLGEEGRAMEYLAFNLAQERLSIGLMGLAVASASLDWTVDYVKERTAFGQPIASFQNTKFTLAEVATEIEGTQPFIDQCITELNAGELTAAKAAMAKLWGSELQNRITDRCLQLFGGYGYMREYPIAVAYADARIATIYGGTSEIMKTIISKDVLA